jgi:hypothetical protein
MFNPMLCEYRSLGGNTQFINNVELDISFLMYNKMLLVTECERRIRSYWIVTEDMTKSLVGHGFANLLKINSQEVQLGLVSWSIIVASNLRKDDLEAGAIMHLGNDKYIESVQKVLLIVDHSQESRANLVKIQHNVGLIISRVKFETRMFILIPDQCEAVEMKGNLLNVEGGKLSCIHFEETFEPFSHDNFLVEVGVFRTFQIKFIRARVFVWLFYMLLMSEAAVLVGSGNFSGGAKTVSGSFVSEVSLCIRIECKKGMNFEAVMPINNKYSISLPYSYNIPTFGSANFSVFSACSKPRWSNQIHLSRHRALGSD